MNRVRKVAVAVVTNLWELLVDDGFLAIAALVSIAIGYGLSRDGALGPVNTVGWAMVVLIIGSMIVSLRRAIAAKRR